MGFLSCLSVGFSSCPVFFRVLGLSSCKHVYVHTQIHTHTNTSSLSLARVCVCVLSPSFCLSRAQGGASKGGVQNRCNGYPAIDNLETELSARYAKDKIEGAAAGMASSGRGYAY